MPRPKGSKNIVKPKLSPEVITKKDLKEFENKLNECLLELNKNLLKIDSTLNNLRF